MPSCTCFPNPPEGVPTHCMSWWSRLEGETVIAWYCDNQNPTCEKSCPLYKQRYIRGKYDFDEVFLGAKPGPLTRIMRIVKSR